MATTALSLMTLIMCFLIGMAPIWELGTLDTEPEVGQWEVSGLQIVRLKAHSLPLSAV